MEILFPTLYKRTATGAVQRWEIRTEGAKIVTTYGQVGGAQQITTDEIRQGKNLGKKNATTPETQAEAEALARWTKQVERKGYVKDPDRAAAGLDDQQGGVKPMLAHKFQDHEHKVRWPAYVSPKLDGIRCIAVMKKGKCTLWSRSRSPITSAPHIVKAIENVTWMGDFVLDGELFTPGIPFERITSLTRTKDPQPGSESIEYHVFDLPKHPGPFSERLVTFEKMFDRGLAHPIHLVENFLAEDKDEMTGLFTSYLEEGYEGLMLRDIHSRYEGKRSTGLLKVKLMADEDYPIVGVKEGRGKMAGLAIFRCSAGPGKEFDVKMRGSLNNLAKYVQDESTWRGKKLVVQYQNLTEDGIPRFPVGLAIREPEL